MFLKALVRSWYWRQLKRLQYTPKWRYFVTPVSKERHNHTIAGFPICVSISLGISDNTIKNTNSCKIYPKKYQKGCRSVPLANWCPVFIYSTTFNFSPQGWHFHGIAQQQLIAQKVRSVLVLKLFGTNVKAEIIPLPVIQIWLWQSAHDHLL